MSGSKKTFRERLTANAEDFDAIVAEMLFEIESLQGETDALTKRVAELETPSHFGTEDEHFADSIEDLAEQFDNCYKVGEIITVYISKDLGSINYMFGLDAQGNPTMKAIAKGE